jgi:hypothetical protein
MWTFWAEAVALQTAGGGIKPQAGWEGAVGFDYRLPKDPWHVIVEFRYGQSRSGNRASSNSSRFFSTTGFFFTSTAGPFPSTITINSNSTTQESVREHHFVADFMVGRDLGVGSNKSQVRLGIRVVDLYAAAQVLQNTQTDTQTTTYSTATGLVVTNTSASSSAFASWRSRFFGAGPRLAFSGGMPIVGAWSFDYGAGIAGLIGNRSFKYTTLTTVGFANSFNTTAFVFNADVMAALAYSFSPGVKLSGGIRADYYSNPLNTYNFSTGAVTQISRTYWGPFLRLTGSL